MPQVEWWLTRWEESHAMNNPNGIKITIDPALISGSRGAFGAALFLPYKYTVPADSALTGLISLEGWIDWGFNNNAVNEARLRIPSQQVWPAPQYQLQVPLSDRQIEAIEHARNGSLVNLSVQLGGIAVGSAELGGVVPVQNTILHSVVIERERWLTVLQQLKAGTRRLVELPEPRLPRDIPAWAECLRHLDAATLFYQRGEYEQVLISCRAIAEGIPHVLCEVWGLPPQGRRTFAQWITEIVNRLTTEWPEDSHTPGMLQTMLTGTWRWSAPAPHYGTGIPLREDVTFALGVCTNLLHFAGQVLQAHPQPFPVAVPAAATTP